MFTSNTPFPSAMLVLTTMFINVSNNLPKTSYVKVIITPYLTGTYHLGSHFRREWRSFDLTIKVTKLLVLALIRASNE